MGLLTGAGSTAVRDVLTPGRGQVVHVSATAVALVSPAGRLLVLDGAPGPGSLPCSVLVPGLSRLLSGAGAADVGEPVDLAADGVRVGGWTARVSRWWAPARVHAGRAAVQPASGNGPLTSAAREDGVLDDRTSRALRAAVEALDDRDPVRAAALLTAVLGRGPGSTPAADDAVAGLLLAARAWSDPDRSRLVDQVGHAVAEAAADRTTLLSAELLRLAADGVATQTVVDAIRHPTPARRAAVRRLGASSGAATLAGIDLVATRSVRVAA